MTTIVTALAAGVAKGMGDGASAAVADAYRALKGGLARLFGGSPPAQLVLAQHESDPDTWRAPLAKLLTEAGADREEEILTAARQLLELADSMGGRTDMTVVNAQGANIGTIGDHARQTNVFGAPPAALSTRPGFAFGPEGGNASGIR
ncbi:hypothetical protein GPX89_09145 [Nocardia sp. ET3-3]|uniref:Uncharacterized protein n=1 Tax=Nocardia terrae TaxID=2675851 RepID=A0A7K1UST6_9NOCA|nr:hypothetical protein [Nocardia terrae]MVU77412.1 hypothetical protein [Nocardia terrae]